MTTEQIISILIAAGVVAGVGLIVGLFLGFSGKLLAVQGDSRTDAVRECLPGNNCGGCGFSGCDGLAEAIVKGEAPVNACPVGGQSCADAVAEALGVEAISAVKRVAFVKCSGSCDQIKFNYTYYGDADCHRVAMAPGRGSKSCAYSCTGLGSCARACPFGAIHVVDGRAAVDPTVCRGCGLCLSVCPNHLIELLPANAVAAVRCASRERGKTVREMCNAGCIGCGVCTKLCPSGAITVTDNIAHIEQDKCSGCGKCVAKCPAHCIVIPGIPSLVTKEESPHDA